MSASAQPAPRMKISDRLAKVKQPVRVHKHGNCPRHGCALRPHVWPGSARKRGQAAQKIKVQTESRAAGFSNRLDPLQSLSGTNSKGKNIIACRMSCCEVDRLNESAWVRCCLCGIMVACGTRRRVSYKVSIWRL